MQDNDKIIIQNWLEKCDIALFDAKKGIDESRLECAQNRLYYAIFYAVKALSHKDKFASSKHSQLIGWFNKNYLHTNIVEEKTGKIYKVAFEQRQKCDYGLEFKPTQEQLTRHFGEAEVFIAEIKKLLNDETTANC